MTKYQTKSGVISSLLNQYNCVNQ